MKQLSIALLVVALSSCASLDALGQRRSPTGTGSQSNTTNAGKPQTQQQRRAVPARQSGPGLTDYGIEIAPDPRLVVVMAALDAAGWDPTPEGTEPSVFRRLVRKDMSALDPALRARLQDFYRRYMLKDARATAADQAARYVSLAYALGPAPDFAAPARSEDLPSGVIDVLDFAPLVREFYRQTAFAEKLPGYINMYRAAGDEMRRPAIEAARNVLAYLNTRPETTVLERVQASGEADAKKKKNEKSVTVVRERERRFVIVPDLLAAPGALNFRVIGDDYFAVVPANAEPRVSELRRAYLQYVFDPLVLRFSRDVSARRDAIKTLLDAQRARAGAPITPDVYLAVARSLVAAADARMDENARLRSLQLETSERLKAAADQTARESILKDAKEREAAIRDATVAQLAESYESGAVLAFYFAEQLRGLEGSGFDIANFIPAMLADVNVERETKRPQEYASAVERVREVRRREREARESASAAPLPERQAALIKSLSDVDALLRVRNYEEAQARLIALRDQYREEPRIYFALGQAASLSAQDAFDENLQAERLTRALGHFRQTVLLATPDTERSIVLRAHLASGRILAHLERREEAAKEFDEVLRKAGEGDAAFQREAVAEKRKLGAQP